MKNLHTTATASDDATLVRRLKARDRSAMDDLLRLHGSKLYGVAMQIMRNETDAQEVMQDALITIWNKIDSFEGRSAFPTWLYRVTANAGLMKLRKNKRFERNVPLDGAAEDASNVPALQLPDPKEHPGETASRAELGERVRAAIEALPEPYRSAVMLSDVDGLAMNEIAEATGVSVPAVKSRLHRGRLALRKVLEPYLQDQTNRNDGAVRASELKR